MMMMMMMITMISLFTVGHKIQSYNKITYENKNDVH